MFIKYARARSKPGLSFLLEQLLADETRGKLGDKVPGALIACDREEAIHIISSTQENLNLSLFIYITLHEILKRIKVD